MSILGAATTTTQPVAAAAAAAEQAGNPFALLLIFVPLGLVALWLAWHVGVFRRNSVVGPPRVGERESLGVPLLLLGMYVFLFIAAQTAFVGIGGAAASQPVASAPATAPAARPLSDEQTAMVMTWPALIAVGITAAGHRALRPDGIGLLGLGLRQLRRGVAAGVVASGVMIPLVFLVAQLVEILWRTLGYSHPSSHELLYKMRDAPSPLVRYMLIAGAVVVAPLWEEFVFRGHLQTLATYLWGRLAGRRVGEAALPSASPAVDVAPPVRENPTPVARWVSIVFTSLCFASIHYQPGPFPYWMMPPIFFLSLCVGYAYERTGNLWTTITMHACFNATSTILYFAFMR
jgi:membrane protease YdiL (CAAX protease family)